MAIEFAGVLKQAEGVNATGIPVPDAVVAELGSTKNPPVTVRARKAGSTGDWYTYRVSVGNRGGYILSFSAANRASSGLVAGDQLEVTIELDNEPRTIDIPEDLATALTKAGLYDKFLALSPSKQRGFIDPIESAKAVDTRQRRVEKAVSDLTS